MSWFDELRELHGHVERLDMRVTTLEKVPDAPWNNVNEMIERIEALERKFSVLENLRTLGVSGPKFGEVIGGQSTSPTLKQQPKQQLKDLGLHVVSAADKALLDAMHDVDPLGPHVVSAADKAVLDAMRDVDRVWLEECAILDGPFAPPCRAELSRRSSYPIATGEMRLEARDSRFAPRASPPRASPPRASPPRASSFPLPNPPVKELAKRFFDELRKGLKPGDQCSSHRQIYMSVEAFDVFVELEKAVKNEI